MRGKSSDVSYQLLEQKESVPKFLSLIVLTRWGLPHPICQVKHSEYNLKFYVLVPNAIQELECKFRFAIKQIDVIRILR